MIYERLGIIGTVLSIAVEEIAKMITENEQTKDALLAQKRLESATTVIGAIDRRIAELDIQNAQLKEKMAQLQTQKNITSTGSYIAIGAAALIGIFIITRTR